MRLLLDTHTFLWWLAGDRRLSRVARALIGDERNVVFVSAASAWEICTKYRLGKLDDAAEVALDVRAHVAAQAFTELDMRVAHAQRAGLLPGPHRDPFDRMLIAQALVEALPVVTRDTAFDAYPVERLW